MCDLCKIDSRMIPIDIISVWTSEHDSITIAYDNFRILTIVVTFAQISNAGRNDVTNLLVITN